MLDQTVASYGVVDAEAAAHEAAVRLEELTRLGYTLLESGIDAGELEILRGTLAEVYERQVAEFEAASLDASVDADVARCPLAYDLSFLSLATNPALLSFCEQLFGPGFVLLQQNGVTSRPQRSHYQARWHRDLPYQHWVASKPIAIAALFCLDEFSATTGGTYALPASHLHERFPSEEFVRRHQVVMSAPTGTFIVMNAMMFHRAGKNESTAVRRGVNHVIGRPFLAQQIDIPHALGREAITDPFLAGYLGYRWGPAGSVGTWRAAHVSQR